MQLKADLFE